MLVPLLVPLSTGCHAVADSALLISPSTFTRRPANCFDTADSTAVLMVRVRDTISDSCMVQAAEHNSMVSDSPQGNNRPYCAMIALQALTAPQKANMTSFWMMQRNREDNFVLSNKC